MFNVSMLTNWTRDDLSIAMPIMSYGFVSWSETSIRPTNEYMANPNLGSVSAILTQQQLDDYEADNSYNVLSVEEIIDEIT